MHVRQLTFPRKYTVIYELPLSSRCVGLVLPCLPLPDHKPIRIQLCGAKVVIAGVVRCPVPVGVPSQYYRVQLDSNRGRDMIRAIGIAILSAKLPKRKKRSNNMQNEQHGGRTKDKRLFMFSKKKLSEGRIKQDTNIIKTWQPSCTRSCSSRRLNGGKKSAHDRNKSMKT